MVGTALWYLLAAGGAVGATLALLSSLSGGLLLLAAACGWLALGPIIPGGFGFPVLAPVSLCLLASIAAIVAEGRPSPARVPAKVRERQRPTPEELAREQALSMDLEMLEPVLLEPAMPESLPTTPQVDTPHEPPPAAAAIADPLPRQHGPSLALVNLALLVSWALPSLSSTTCISAETCL
jgi:hypothetical protein